MTVEEENVKVTNVDVVNIVGNSKVTKSGRFFSPEISLKIVTAPVRITATESTTKTRGEEHRIELAQAEEPK